MKINDKQLEALHEHLQGGGAQDVPTLAKVAGVSNSEVPEAVKALEAKWPDIYGEDEEEAKAPAKKTAKKAVKKAAKEVAETRQFKLKGADGYLTSLSVVKATDSVVVLEVPVPKDEVDIMLAGKVVTIDLYQLRAHPAAKQVEPYGKTAGELIALGEAAKG
jgi:hypothetical protein